MNRARARPPIEKELLDMSLFGRLARDAGEEQGQGMAEYALILGLIAVVAIISLLFLGQDIQNMVFHQIGETLGDVL